MRKLLLIGLFLLLGCDKSSGTMSPFGAFRDLPKQCDDEVLVAESDWEDAHCVKIMCPNALYPTDFRWANPHCLDVSEHWARTAKIDGAYSRSYLKWIQASHDNYDSCRDVEERTKGPICGEKVPLPPN